MEINCLGSQLRCQVFVYSILLCGSSKDHANIIFNISTTHGLVPNQVSDTEFQAESLLTTRQRDLQKNCLNKFTPSIQTIDRVVCNVSITHSELAKTGPIEN